MDRTWDRQLWLALLVAAVVVIPRSWHISTQSSPSCDDQYHIKRGLWMLGAATPATLNDPPLGEAVIALPLRLLGVRQDPGDCQVLYTQKLSTETMLQIVAVWKGLLLIPGIGLVFHWCRKVYGLMPAWLAMMLVLIDPTITAHTPLAALDVLAMEAVILCGFLLWRYVEQPTNARLSWASVSVAVAMLTKHNAVVMPLVAIAVVLLAARRMSWPWRVTLNRVCSGALITALVLWTLTGFRIAEPRETGHPPGVNYAGSFALVESALNSIACTSLPAGCYVGSMIEALVHVRSGQDAYLWGEHSHHGWWYYIPAVMLYKVPLGIAAVIILGIASLAWRRPRAEEIGLALPIVMLWLLLVGGGLSTGFRHALPAYALLLMLASRCVASGAPIAVKVLAWLGATAAGVHAASFHPHYIPYINAPWTHPWMAISDSNNDWCTTLPAVAKWIDQNAAGRTVWFDGVDSSDLRSFKRYLGDRVKYVDRRAAGMPRDGILIVSPWWIVGLYESQDQYIALRNKDPDAVIANSLLVFDMDRFEQKRATVDSAAAKPQN